MNQSVIKRVIIGVGCFILVIAIVLYNQESKKIKQKANSNHTLSIRHDIINTIHNLDLPIEGDKTAENKIIVFEDLQCPACKELHKLIYPQIKHNLIDTKKASLTTVIVKLPSHNTQQTTTMAYCLGEQKASYYTNFTNFIYQSPAADIPWSNPVSLITNNKISTLQNVNIDQLKTCITTTISQTKGTLYLKILENLYRSDSQMKNNDARTPTVIVNNEYIDHPFQFNNILAKIRKKQKTKHTDGT